VASRTRPLRGPLHQDFTGMGGGQEDGFTDKTKRGHGSFLWVKTSLPSLKDYGTKGPFFRSCHAGPEWKTP